MVFIQFIGDSEHHYITDTDFNIVPEILQKRFTMVAILVRGPNPLTWKLKKQTFF